MSAEAALELPAAPGRENLLTRCANVIRRHPLPAFFLLAYAFSWWPAISYALTGSGPTILSCGPFLAAVAVLSLTGGRPGLKALFRSMRKWRVGARWWAVAILAPVVMTAIATAWSGVVTVVMPTTPERARTDARPARGGLLVVGGGFAGASLARMAGRAGCHDRLARELHALHAAAAGRGGGDGRAAARRRCPCGRCAPTPTSSSARRRRSTRSARC